ncbi:hypothetical protein PBY51_022824 [Eleginops maclovinus]|uniref:Macro domain-containing protein n=1 Tax=Eleginops maclovinus TaxID=56733 RepID=A0AAN7XIL9_ELEMC|nr:hypothetical protein PBY51_022824 [Eleginops maclovinus]
MASELDVPLHGTSLNIVRRCGPTLGQVLLSKFECKATFEGVDFERDLSIGQPKQPPVFPVKKCSFLLRGGVELSVWKADLTNFNVDAVVNAANDGLDHGGGLARALSDAGGPQIQKESYNYIFKNGRLRTGQAIVLGSGSLPCKNIIHAVGPCLTKCPSSTDLSTAKTQLETAIKSILFEVEKHRLQSVAIPAISSGLFNFPLPECADTIVATVNGYYERSYNQGPFPQEIRLANHDDITVNQMEKACHKIFASSSSSSSSFSLSKSAPRTPTPEVHIGNVHLTLKKGKIEEQQADVIVSNASPDRDLKIGQISSALLQKAGSIMQKEIIHVPLTGNILITKPYNLKCQQVFHTLFPSKSTNLYQNSVQVLYDSVTDCLWNAVKNKHTSIAFPAIGTGNLGFDRKEVARTMADAVVDFTKKHPQKKLDVFFIIFPSDHPTYKAFEEQMAYLQQRAPLTQETGAMMPSPLAYEHKNHSSSSRALTPQITLKSSSTEKTREAERWLFNLFNKTYAHVNISNNFILHFGEKEHGQLSGLMEKGVVIEEFFENGHARISVMGKSEEDVIVAGLQVEAMLCSVQEEFVRDEENAICQALMGKTGNFERKKVEDSDQEFSNRKYAFKSEGLRIVKVDKVCNNSLKTIFDMKATQLGYPGSKQMYQRIPAQFCEMVCKTGFHAVYAPPDDAACGEGIYFAGTVKKAMELWKGPPKEEYLYFVEAEVQTGHTFSGKRGFILPPPMKKDPLVMYDSLSGGLDVSIIFSCYQALPTYIITCRRD